MNKSVARPLAVAAVSVLAVGTLGAGPASAGGDHGGVDGDHGYGVAFPLTEKVSDELLDGANGIFATGKADKWADDGRIVLSFPVRDSDRRDKHGKDDGKDRDAWALLGGVAFTGAGPDVTWTNLRVDSERGVVTAVLSGGDRAPILRFAEHQGRRDRTGGSHGGATLKLTGTGAFSLNRAADGSPFEAGDAFAGGQDCDR
jgi:hypothetical protein